MKHPMATTVTLNLYISSRIGDSKMAFRLLLSQYWADLYDLNTKIIV